MADVMLMKVGGGSLMPADERSREIVSRWKLGQGVRAHVSRARNIAFHRKFFALVSVVAEYSETFNTTDKALVAVKIAAGHCDFMPDPRTGELMAVPKSISFASLDEDEFADFYERALTGVITHILPAMDRQSLEQATELVIGFA